MNRVYVFPLLVLLFLPLVAATARPGVGEEKGFVPLFDGKSLAGWKMVDGWNKLLIRAVGSKIETRVNGVPCADLTDDADKRGFFALQMHPGKKGRILWRNIRVKQLVELPVEPLRPGQSGTAEDRPR